MLHLAWIECAIMGINFDIVCSNRHSMRPGKENNVSIPWKTGKSTIVTHGTIRVNFE